jgi:hypothetical protein
VPGIPRTPRSRRPVRLAITAAPENAPTPGNWKNPAKIFPLNSLTIFQIFFKIPFPYFFFFFFIFLPFLFFSFLLFLSSLPFSFSFSFPLFLFLFLSLLLLSPSFPFLPRGQALRPTSALASLTSGPRPDRAALPARYRAGLLSSLLKHRPTGPLPGAGDAPEPSPPAYSTGPTAACPAPLTGAA